MYDVSTQGIDAHINDKCTFTIIIYSLYIPL